MECVELAPAFPLVGLVESASKPHALHTLRDICGPQIFAACEGIRLLRCNEAEAQGFRGFVSFKKLRLCLFATLR
jgi:hypothetical protein